MNFVTGNSFLRVMRRIFTLWDSKLSFMHREFAVKLAVMRGRWDMKPDRWILRSKNESKVFVTRLDAVESMACRRPGKVLCRVYSILCHRNMEKTKSKEASQCSAANQVTAIAPTDAGLHQCGGLHYLLSVHDSTWPHIWLLLQQFSRILPCNIVHNTEYCLLSGISWFSIAESFGAASQPHDGGCCSVEVEISFTSRGTLEERMSVSETPRHSAIDNFESLDR